MKADTDNTSATVNSRQNGQAIIAFQDKLKPAYLCRRRCEEIIFAYNGLVETVVKGAT